MICGKCNKEASSLHSIFGESGYCLNCYHVKRDKEFPFIVRFDNEYREFATTEEANEFVDELHRAYVERKN
jgi:hypothetical protein